MTSTIRFLSDVDDALIDLNKVDGALRDIMRTSDLNDPTEDEARVIVGMVGTVIEKLADIQRDLTPVRIKV